MSTAAAAAVDSSNSDDSDADGAAAWSRDSADESDNEAEEEAPAAPGAARHKRYRRTASTSSKDADGASSSRPPVRRRILRKDRRATLEMLTSDDDANAYQEARPSAYREPAARRNLHETAPHLKSSFETLYHPELNRLDAAPELLTSTSSESLVSEAAEVLGTGGSWQLASGPKLPSPYLDVSRRPAANSRLTPEQADRKDDGPGREGGSGFPLQQEATSGELWTEFGGHSPAAVDRDWAAAAAAAASRKSQPVSLSIRVSKPSVAAPTSSNGSVGVNVEIELSRSLATAAAAAAELPVTEQLIASHRQPGQTATPPLKPPLLPDKPTVAASVRGRRVLPAVPDSADLEVSDLLRGDAAPPSSSVDAASRPKSAVEILVPKGRCSSVQQLPASSTVSQQLRSLFHNPSPHIMLHRSATQQTQPQPPQTARAELSNGAGAGKSSHKYAPLRASHGVHQPQHSQPANSQVNGRQSAVQMLMSKKPPAPRSLMSTPQQPPMSTSLMSTPQQPPLPRSLMSTPQQPPAPRSLMSTPQQPPLPRSLMSTLQQSPEPLQRHSQGSLQPSQRIRQDAHYPTAFSQAASPYGPRAESNSGMSQSSSGTPSAVHLLASPHANSHQRPVFLAPDQSQPRQSAVQALFPNPASLSRASQVGPQRAPSNAVYRTVLEQPPPLPPRRAKQFASDRPTRSRPEVEQPYWRVQPAIQLETTPPADDLGGSGEEDSGCCQSSGEYLLATEPFRAAAGSPANPTRIQTNPRTGRAAASLESERSQQPPAPRGAHLPPNAVRVLPRMDSVEVGELRRVLATRSERAAPGKGADRPEDAIEGLERMCRDMRLHDDQLLDGAERRDTAIRVQARMEALRASAQNWATNDQSQRLLVDSSRKQHSAMGMGPAGSQPQNQQLRSHALLQPGERESGPEIIL